MMNLCTDVTGHSRDHSRHKSGAESGRESGQDTHVDCGCECDSEGSHKSTTSTLICMPIYVEVQGLGLYL